MVVTSELTVLHRSVDELRSAVGTVRVRYGDIPAVRRLIGDVERIDLDAADLDSIPVPSEVSSAGPIHVIDDRPADPSLWAEADDEGLGGYRGGNR
jgi:hypothetical protein